MRTGRLWLGIAAALALVLPTIARAEPAPVLVDAYGHSIGPVLAPGSVLMTVQGRVYRLAVHEGGFDADAPRALYYESTDCSGTGYFGDTLVPPLAYVGIRSQGPGQNLYAPGTPSAERQISSTKIVNDPQAQCQPFYMPGPGPTPTPVPVPMNTAPVLALPWGPSFVPPFTVLLR